MIAVEKRAARFDNWQKTKHYQTMADDLWKQFTIQNEDDFWCRYHLILSNIREESKKAKVQNV